MEPKDGTGAGDSPAPKKKRAPRTPSARKRSPKAVRSAEQDGATETTTEREVAPRAEPQPARTEPASTGRDPVAARTSGQRTSGERSASIDNADERDGGFGERDADRAADIAADLKSWMDTRREDRDHRGEVL